MQGPRLSLSISMVQTGLQRQEQRYTFAQEHPLLELMAFYDRAKPLTLTVTDTRNGRSVGIDYVIAPQRLMGYVDDGEHYGISAGGMIFVSDSTPYKMAPLVALKLFEEQALDPGVHPDDRSRHIKAALDAVRLAPVLGLSPDEIRSFVEVLIQRDPSGIIRDDPLVQKYAGMTSWNVPERTAYLEAHHANWRVRRSQAFAAQLGADADIGMAYRDLWISKADIILRHCDHVNPYLLGQFIRQASTVPIGVPFEVDSVMSGPAYALTEESCGIGLISFIEQGRPEVGKNTVVRAQTEHAADHTWTSLVVRVETGLLFLERNIERRVGELRGKVDGLAIRLEGAAERVRGQTAPGALVLQEPEALATLSQETSALMVRAQAALSGLGHELATLEGLKRAAGMRP
jgi:hypothetical protein